MPMISMLLLLVLLLFISAFFSASETGMMAINRYRLQHQAKAGQLTAKRIQRLLERPDRLLGIILIGNTLANISASSMTAMLMLQLFGHMGVAIGTGVLTALVLVFAETLPKTVAALKPDMIAWIAAWPLSLLLWIFYPLVYAMNGVVNGFLLLVRIRVKKKPLDRLNSEELKVLLTEAATMSKRHRDMLLRLLDLEKVTVEDIMTPRAEITGIDLADNWEIVLSMIASATQRRLPVYRGSIDQVIGVLDLSRLSRLLAKKQAGDVQFDQSMLESAITPPYFVPKNTRLTAQLLRFQIEKQQYALVVDEYGDIEGMVTLDDILEEIVGEFIVDVDAVSTAIHPQADGTFLIDGTTTLREINKILGWHLSTTGPKTLNGLIIEQLESMPQSNVCLRVGDYCIETLQIKENAVKIAKVKQQK